MQTKTILTVFIIYSAVFLVNTSGKEKPTSEKKSLKWNSKNWITESKEPNPKDALIKERVRRHLFKKRPEAVVLINNQYFDNQEDSGWGAPPPPPTPGWTHPTTTTTTTTTTRRPTTGWTTTRGWSQPTPPPPQNGWGDGPPQQISGGHSWSIGHGHGAKGSGVFGFPHRVIQGGLDIFKKPVISSEESDEQYERKTFGISIYKGKQKY